MAKLRFQDLVLSVSIAGSSACSPSLGDGARSQGASTESVRLEPSKTSAERTAAEAAPRDVPDASADVCSRSALESCASKCEKREGAACQVLAEHALAQKSNAEARVFAEKACDYGTSWGCALRGSAAADDEAFEDAVRWYSKACSLGNENGCAGAAGLAWKKLKDANRAFPLAKRACDLDVTSCEGVAQMHLEGAGTPKDGTQAVTIFEAGCKAGLVMNCSLAAKEHEEGKNVKKDFSAAEKVLSFACEKLESPEKVRTSALTKSSRQAGCFLLAELYDRKNDAKSATKAYTQACELGAPAACKKVGLAMPSAALTSAAVVK